MPFAIYALSAGAFVIATTEFVIMGLLPDVAADLHVSLSKAGMLIGGYALGVVLGAPLLTPVLSRLPRKRVLVGLMLLFTAGNAACALLQGYEAVFVARLVTAFAHASFFGLGSVVAAELAPPGKKASALATMFLGATIANIVGVPVGTALGQAFGWRVPFWLISCLGALAAGGIALYVPAVKAAGRPDLRSEVAVLLRPRTLRALLITFLGFGGTFTAFTFVAPILTDVTGFSATAIPWLLTLFGLGMMAGNWLGGRMADANLARSVRISLAGLVLVLACIGLSLHSMPWMAICMFLFGAAAFAVIPPLQMQVLEKAAQAPTLAAAFNVAAFNAGNAAGAFLGGRVLATAGLAAVPWAASLLSLSGLALCIAGEVFAKGTARRGVDAADPWAGSKHDPQPTERSPLVGPAVPPQGQRS